MNKRDSKVKFDTKNYKKIMRSLKTIKLKSIKKMFKKLYSQIELILTNCF